MYYFQLQAPGAVAAEQILPPAHDAIMYRWTVATWSVAMSRQNLSWLCGFSSSFADFIDVPNWVKHVNLSSKKKKK